MRAQSSLLLCSVVAIMLAVLVPREVSAIPNYKECLECFYANRTTTYFCQSNRRCLPLRSTQCSAANIIYRDFQCVNGF